MKHPEKYTAKRYDTPNRSRAFTDTVYSGESGTSADLWAKMNAAQRSYDPPKPDLIPLVGEMHGHTNLSDGRPDIDTYFRNIRDVAKLDFAVLTDHDHGGVGKPELWVGSPSKWDLIRQKTLEYRVEGKFSTLLGYERDSYPFYNNLVLYFRDDDAEMIRGERDGELTEAELREILARDDVIACPHDTYSLNSNTDFTALQDVLGTKIVPDIQALIQRNNLVHGHAAEGNHTVNMGVDRNHFISLVQTGDQELITSLLGGITLKIALIAGITNIH